MGIRDAKAYPTIPRDIFKAYDIRGVVGDGFGPDEAYVIGRAIATCYSGVDSIAVGFDGRHSSPSIAQALIDGLNDGGINTLDIGAAATPTLYFAAVKHTQRSGLMVTGSHNPPQYNGIKMMVAGHTLAGEDIQQLYEICAGGQFVEGSGRSQTRNVMEEYVTAITTDITLSKSRPMHFAVDCGNGIAGPAVKALFSRLDCKVEYLYCDVDGDFPHHHPNPSIPENLAMLIQVVKDQQLDFGMAFDGDGDRLGVIDNAGNIIWADRQMMVFAKAVLSQHPGATILYDVKSSNILAQIIARHGGVPSMCRTGHSFVKAAIKETGAALAGEMSGHLFFNDRWFGFDDGIYAAARFLELVSNQSLSCSDLFAALPKTLSTPELNVHFAAENMQHEFMQRFVQDADFGAATLSTIDGLRVEFDDGWGLVRASNTTPCLVLRFEAESDAKLEQIKLDFRTQLLKTDATLTLPF